MAADPWEPFAVGKPNTMMNWTNNDCTPFDHVPHVTHARFALDMLRDAVIVRAIGQAFALHQEVLRTGMGLGAVARSLGIDPARGRQLHLLTRLSPTILKAALSGTLTQQVSLLDLRAAAGELDWSLQASHLGMR